uniref:Uncharacterized protein n=1 Tax=Periophthalmus magnuspinnatus TaxID=409849 RepID=A0A3B4AXE1_9GOBI
SFFLSFQVTSSGTSPVHSNYPTPEVPRQGTIIPNRIFVAGLDHKSHLHVVYLLRKDWKMIQEVNGVYCKEKRLCIRPAFHKQHDSGSKPMFSMEPMPMPSGTVYLTTSGFPYTFHNGVAYFHSPRAGPNPHLWTPVSLYEEL